MINNSLSAINNNLFQYLNSFVGKSISLDTFVLFCAHYLPYWLILGACIPSLFWLYKHLRSRGALKNIPPKIFFFPVFILGSGFFARFVVAEIIRYFYYNPRPFAVLDNVSRLILHEPTASFPSGHTVFFFAMATAFFFFYKRWSALFFLGAFLAGISRVIAGVHWPLDILGGIVVGVATPVVIYRLLKNNICRFCQ